jgi:hypothetical protein
MGVRGCGCRCAPSARSFWAVLLLTLAGMLVYAAPATDDGLVLEWTAPAGCPSRAELGEQIVSLLGSELDDERGKMHVVASARLGDDGIWTAEIELRSRGGVRHRTIPRARDCVELADATAVVVAIAIDPGAMARIETGADEPDDDGELPVVPEPVVSPPLEVPSEPVEPIEDPPVEPEPREDLPALDIVVREPTPPPSPIRERLRAMIAVVGGVGYGSIPGAAGSLGGDIGLLLPRVRVTASGTWWFRTGRVVDDANVDFGQWSVAVRGCPVFGVTPMVELMACVGVEAGQTLARTDGLAEDRRRADPWIAGLAAPTLAVVPTRWLAIRAGVELVVPVIRSVYEVRGFGEVFQATPAGVRGLIALETRFP